MDAITIQPRKPLLMAVLLFWLLSTVSATSDVQVTPITDEAEIAPGTTGTAGEYDIAVRNDSVFLEDVFMSGLPFDADFFTEDTAFSATCNEETGECPYVNRSVSVNVSVEEGFSAGNYTGEIRLFFAEKGEFRQPITVTVPEVRDWEINHVDVAENVSVGGIEQLAEIDVRNRGNERVTVSVDVTGNITEYLLYSSETSIPRGLTTTMELNTEIPSSAELGYYEGEVVLQGAGLNETIPVSTAFVDTTSPDIRDMNIPVEVMATTDASWLVSVTDNQEVASVTGEVFREVEVIDGNDTVLENHSIAAVNFSREDQAGIWSATFDETSERGDYHVVVTVEDLAGNTVEKRVLFKITTLEAVTVLDENFRFDPAGPEQEVVYDIIEIDNGIETPVTLTLDRFVQIGSNDSVSLGILHRGDEVSEKFDGEDSSIMIEEPGVYALTVKSGTPQSVEGTIGVKPIEQHRELPGIEFEASIEDRYYPDAGNYSLGNFNGYMDYVKGDGGFPEQITFTGYIDADQCLGATSFSQCIAGYELTLGAADELREENKQLQQENADLERSVRNWRVGTVLSFLSALLFVVVYRRKKAIEDRVTAFKVIPKR